MQGGSDGGESQVAHPNGHSQLEPVWDLSQVRRLSKPADFYANPPPLDQLKPLEQVQVAKAKPARQRRTSCGGRRAQTRPSLEAPSLAENSFAI